MLNGKGQTARQTLWGVGDRPRLAFIIRCLPVQVKGVMQGADPLLCPGFHRMAVTPSVSWNCSPPTRPTGKIQSVRACRDTSSHTCYSVRLP